MKNQNRVPAFTKVFTSVFRADFNGFYYNFMRQVLITVWKAAASFMTSHCKWNHNQQTMSINGKPVKMALKYLYCD